MHQRLLANFPLACPQAPRAKVVIEVSPAGGLQPVLVILVARLHIPQLQESAIRVTAVLLDHLCNGMPLGLSLIIYTLEER